MRLPVNARSRLVFLAITVALAGCSSGSGGADFHAGAAAADPTTGPAADYPVVVGEPYRIDGRLYTPIDTLNYDEVGHIARDAEGGADISGAHQTLPLPSYVEVTSLESGRTILLRMERRGPMVTSRIAALSDGALEQLGVSPGSAVRIRRVNPPEVERAVLRQGRAAPLRMDTPLSLVEVLRRKLDAPAAMPDPTSATTESATAGPQQVAVGPSVVAMPAPQLVTTPAAKPEPVQSARTGKLAVQAATFSSRANADRAAAALDGYVLKAGQYWRVQTGPFADGEQAEAALAKVKAAGYTDARVITLN